jgi:hypothetical protein
MASLSRAARIAGGATVLLLAWACLARRRRPIVPRRPLSEVLGIGA